MVQKIKKFMHARAVSQPEAIVVREELLSMAVVMAQTQTTERLLSAEQRKEQKSAGGDATAGRRRDHGRFEQLLGAPQKTNSVQQAEDVEALRQMLRDLPVEERGSYPAGDPNVWRVERYTRAELRSGELIWSSGRHRKGQRIGYWGLANWEGWGSFAAEVTRFLRVSGRDQPDSNRSGSTAGDADGGDEVSVQRIAVCNLHAITEEQSFYAGRYYYTSASPSGTQPPKPANSNYGVNLVAIEHKLIWFDGTASKAHMHRDMRRYIFVPYPNNLPYMAVS